jgi:hypothetical protein
MMADSAISLAGSLKGPAGEAAIIIAIADQHPGHSSVSTTKGYLRWTMAMMGLNHSARRKHWACGL